MLGAAHALRQAAWRCAKQKLLELPKLLPATAARRWALLAASLRRALLGMLSCCQFGAPRAACAALSPAAAGRPADRCGGAVSNVALTSRWSISCTAGQEGGTTPEEAQSHGRGLHQRRQPVWWVLQHGQLADATFPACCCCCMVIPCAAATFPARCRCPPSPSLLHPQPLLLLHPQPAAGHAKRALWAYATEQPLPFVASALFGLSGMLTALFAAVWAAPAAC